MIEKTSFLTHLEYSMCGQRLKADHLWNLCPDCNKPLLVRYDLEAARDAINPEGIARRDPNL